MRRIVVTAVGGITALALALASPALASTGHSANRASRSVRIQVAVGERLTKAGADRLMDRIARKDLKGFTMERDGKRFEVERGFKSLRAALREIKKLRRDGFRAHLELEKHN